MSEQTAFLFDAVTCSGCKACVIACKDKHGLGAGQNWRRVYEVSGGDWYHKADAWVGEGVSGYALSVACNHCEEPICMEVCPASAIEKRGDGLVLLDAARCIGCGYCAWACPYGALQYNPVEGVMGKCTFCVDLLDQGLAPACAAACPMRALDYHVPPNGTAQKGFTVDAAEITPLPSTSLTRPALYIRPHAQAKQLEAAGPLVYGPSTPEKAHGPLVAFTMLAQFAAGIILGWSLVGGLGGIARGENLVFGLAFLASLAGMIVSMMHLGRPGRFLGALRNVRQSWLSREVWFAGTFTAGAFILWAVEAGGFQIGALAGLLQWGTALAGVGLVYSMARLYMLRTVPTWAPVTTMIVFFTTTLLLGLLTAGALGSGGLHWGWRAILAGFAIAHWIGGRGWARDFRVHKLRISGSKVPPAWYTLGRHLGFQEAPFSSMTSGQISKTTRQMEVYRQVAALLVGLLILFWPPWTGVFTLALICFAAIEAWARTWFYRGYYRVGI